MAYLYFGLTTFSALNHSTIPIVNNGGFFPFAEGMELGICIVPVESCSFGLCKLKCLVSKDFNSFEGNEPARIETSIRPQKKSGA